MNNIWDPNWIASLNETNFKTLRFMDWQRTNNNPTTEWSNRTMYNHFTQTSDYGIAIEYIIDLIFYLNTIQTQRFVLPWICIPHAASDDYIEKLAVFIKENYFDMLDSYSSINYETDDGDSSNNYKIIIEYSNECWNSQFDCYSYMVEQYNNNNDSLNQDNIANVWQWYAKRVCDIRQIFDKVLNNSEYSNQLYIPMATQNVNSWITNQALKFEYNYYNYYSGTGAGNNVETIMASECVNGVAIAPYFCMYNMTDEQIARSRNEELFDNLVSKKTMNYELDFIISQIEVASSYYGYNNESLLKVITYEGGWHCVPPYSSWRDNITIKYEEMCESIRIRDVLYGYYYDFYNVTNFSSIFTYFDHVGWAGQWGNWGHIRFQKDYFLYNDSDGSYKWQAIKKIENDISSLIFDTVPDIIITTGINTTTAGVMTSTTMDTMNTIITTSDEFINLTTNTSTDGVTTTNVQMLTTSRSTVTVGKILCNCSSGNGTVSDTSDTSDASNTSGNKSNDECVGVGFGSGIGGFVCGIAITLVATTLLKTKDNINIKEKLSLQNGAEKASIQVNE